MQNTSMNEKKKKKCTIQFVCEIHLENFGRYIEGRKCRLSLNIVLIILIIQSINMYIHVVVIVILVNVQNMTALQHYQHFTS